MHCEFHPVRSAIFLAEERDKERQSLANSLRQDSAKRVLSTFPIILLSGICYVLLRLSKLQEVNRLLYEMLYTFIVLALAEETVKYWTFRRVLQKTDYPCSWMDAAMLMTIVGIGFGCMESALYMISESAPVVLIRGLCVPHAGYGFIVGYFYGKGCETGKPGQRWIGFVLAWFLHGLYDFSLSEEFIAINDNLMFVGLALAVLDILLFNKTLSIFPAGFVPTFVIGLGHTQRMPCGRCLVWRKSASEIYKAFHRRSE